VEGQDAVAGRVRPRASSTATAPARSGDWASSRTSRPLQG
jgi:hypothetical protein